MAIAQNFGTTKPSLLLDFANTKQLDPRITFTRASTATFYNGVTTAMAEQNLFTYSQAFDNAAWDGNFVGSKPSVTANSVVAPDGTTTADTLNFTTQFQAIGQGAWVSGTTYTFSVWMKIATGTRDIILNNSASTNLATFTVTSTWTRFVYTGTSGAGSVYVALQDRNASGFVSVDMWGAQLEQRSAVTAYTATTTQAITNYIPVLQSAASGVARFDNNPTTGESLGLLIEESRTNFVTYSEQFDNAAWIKNNVTVTANQVVAPDGNLTADLCTTSAANSLISRSITIGADTATYTQSIYVRWISGSTNMFVRAALTGGTSVAKFLTINALTGAFVAGDATYTLTSVGNNWYRLSISITNNGTNTTYNLQNYTTADTVNTNSLALWGSQLEAGAFATSYIPTVASTVTRAADAASMTGTNFSSWYNTAQGTIYVETSNYNLNPWSVPFQILTSGGNIYIRRTTTTGVSFVVDGQSASASAISGDGYRAAGGYQVGQIAISANGTTVGTITSTVSPATSMIIGSANGNFYQNGSIKKIAYYPLRVTNAQLQALTS